VLLARLKNVCGTFRFGADGGMFYTQTRGASTRGRGTLEPVCLALELCESIAADLEERRKAGEVRMSSTETAKRRRVSQKAERFTESVMREMTREALKHGAVNLSQGFPDFPAPEDVKRAAAEAIAADVNQYAITWGAKDFRDDVEFTRHLVREIGVACVPGSSFYSRPELGSQQVRFCFCKKDSTLEAAAERLRKLR
jgi:hypothetical protein